MTRRESDPRVQRTCGAILESFNQLVLERRYDEIAVMEIIDSAGVGRSTFYEHFRNKDEVLRQSMSRLLSILADAVTDDGGTARVQFLLEHFHENRRRARELLNGPAATPVAHQLSAQIEARLSAHCGQHGATTILPMRLAAMQIAQAQLALIRGWLDLSPPCPALSAAVALERTSRAMFVAVLSRH